MKLNHMLSGTGVALITPFKNGMIDYTQLETVIEYVIAGGVDYVVCLGTTGEAVTLTMEECLEVKQFTVKVVNERIPVVFGLFGGSFTARITERMKDYNLDGVTALLSSSPNYIKPTQEGIIKHYEALAAATPLPIIMYNVPSRTASNMEADTVIKLANQRSKIIGIKEASGDMYQGARIAAEVPDEFLVLSGDDLTTLPLIACGGHGVISVIANAFPRSFSLMIKAALEGNFEKARSFNQPLLKMYKWIFLEGSPSGIKFVMSHMGLCNPELRLPLMELSSAGKKAMMVDLEEAIACEKSLF
ncbi:MAG: 4-hydroxy-tetrahydrodipicolinate synthase [Saprospiraceae bacterium]|nr:4-hydroxy-tetrahydrodipicolinate synthase [Saprospiraceae bacterium]